MSERGEHRAIYTVLLQSPEFLELTPEGQLVWFHLKLMLGPCGIDVIPAVEAQLEEATNMPSEGVRKGMGDAIDKGFVRRERNVLWMVNGLKFEPSRTVTNKNHRTSIQKHIGGLPKLKIVNDFAEYYGLEQPFPDVGDTQSHSASPTPSPSGGDTRSRITDNGERITDNGEKTPPDGDADPSPEDWQSEEVGNWNGGQVFAAYVEYCQRRGWPDPPKSQRGKLGAACKRIGDANSPRQITMAMVGMGNLFPHSAGEPWDPMDLERKFSKAHAAATKSEDLQEQAFAEAFLSREAG